MALHLSTRSTQIGIQKRLPVIEFEPLTRGAGGAQPGRLSLVQNVTTPMGSG